jgi:outer membrane biosynthesis protein TonB
MMKLMRMNRLLLLAAVLLLLLPLHAQQTPLPASQAVELEPLIFADGIHTGELELSIDLDGSGNVANATVISGDASLQPLALRAAKVFRHTNYASVTGMQLHMSFADGKTGAKTVMPKYPGMAVAGQGVVELVAAVAPDGSVSDVTAISGPPMLRGSAIEALKQWKFVPQQQDGHAVKSHAFVMMKFELNQH